MILTRVEFVINGLTITYKVRSNFGYQINVK